MATAHANDPSQRAEIPAPLTEHLQQAEQRVRHLDVTRGLLLLLAGSLAFLLVVVLLDRRFDLSLGFRRLALLAYLIGAGLHLSFFVIRPLRTPVNPRYLARLIERTIPRAHNRVLNGVELQNQKLPQAIRHAVEEQAMQVLEEVEPERAFRDRRILWLGGASGLLGVGVLALALVVGLRPFGAFLGRTFLPFGFSAPLPTRTQVTIRQPVGGHATVTLGNPVTIVAAIEGRIPPPRDPDAPRLLFRTNFEEPWRERRLSADESGREYAVNLPPADVGQGFFYQVLAGDGRSPEYQIKARSAPNLREWSVLSKYPTYTGWPERIRDARKLEDLRGTELTIQLQANRPLEDVRLEFRNAEERTRLVTVRSDPSDPTRATLRWTLEESGRYRVRFTSREGEEYVDPNWSEMVAVPDHPPHVAITQPGPEISCPPDGLFEIHGEARDDVGVQGITLHAQVVGGPRLRSQPYRSPEQIRLPHGGYPIQLDYLGFLDLGAVQTEEGGKVALKTNDEVEYWLEARDACDLPQPGVTASRPRHKVKISASRVDQKKVEEARRQAEKTRKEHEASQDQQRRKEDQEREKARQESEEGKRQKEKGKSQAEKPGGGSEQQAKDRETAERAEQLKKELDGREGRSGEPSRTSEGKGEKGPAGSSREDGKGGEGGKDKEGKQPGQSKDQGSQSGKPGEDKGGQGKPGGTPADRKGAGQGKEGGGQGAGEGRSGEPSRTLGGGEAKPGQGTGGEPSAEKGSGKEGNAATGDKPGTGKGRPDMSGANGNPGQSKPGPVESDGNGQPGEGKPAGEGAGKKPENATVGDVRERAGDLKSANEATRDQAARALEQIRGKANDARAREEAARELEKSGNSWATPACTKPGNGEAGSGNRGESKPGGDKPDGKAGSGKPAGGGGPPEAGKGKGGVGGGGSGEPRPTPGGGPPPASTKDRGDGQSSPRRPGTPDRGTDTAARPSRPGEHRASVLQLEDFRKRVTRQMLQDMKMSPADFERFLKDYESLARRQQAKGEPEKLPTRPVSGTLPPVIGRTIPPTGTDRSSESPGEGRPRPPAEYRNEYAEFLKLMSRPDR